MTSEGSCAWCYTCQVCIECEAYAGMRRPAQPAQRPVQPQQPRPPIPQMPPPMAEERIRQIIIDVLIELGLIPEAKKRASITSTK